MNYQVGDLLQDYHPQTKGKNNLIMILQVTEEHYVIWKGMTNSIVEWDREDLEDDLHLTKVK